MSSLKILLSKLVLACVVSTAILSAGCYGSFALTKKVHTWNGEVSENKFVVWAVFVGLTVIPVYGVAVAVDALVMNALEFWTGDNPADGVATRLEKNDDGTLTFYRGDQVYRAVLISDDQLELYRGDQRIGVATIADNGEMTVTDERGETRPLLRSHGPKAAVL